MSYYCNNKQNYYNKIMLYCVKLLWNTQKKVCDIQPVILNMKNSNKT